MTIKEGIPKAVMIAPWINPIEAPTRSATAIPAAGVHPDLVTVRAMVAALTPFDSEAEVLARANDSEYGLVAYLHSNDPRRIYRCSRALQYGMVAVNRTKVTGAPIPFGGMKQSGVGREGAQLGLEAYTEVKYVCRDWR